MTRGWGWLLSLVVVLNCQLWLGVETGLGHHFKGLPHYNYFENYPQVPEEEFLGQAGEYELSLVVYDFQGINREAVEEPDSVRLFLVVFSLLNNKVYQGKLTLEVLDRKEVVAREVQERAELENLYSLRRKLNEKGKYSLRVTLHDEGGATCVIPFVLSSQKVHWGKWIGLGLLVVVTVAAVGARKARVTRDRRAAHEQAGRKGGARDGSKTDDGGEVAGAPVPNPLPGVLSDAAPASLFPLPGRGRRGGSG